MVGLGLALLAIVVVVLVIKNPVFPRAFDGELPVRVDDLRRHVVTLANDDEARHFANPDALQASADYIRDSWIANGFAVRDQPFDVGGVTYRNLITSYGPSDQPLVVVGAHYDVCGEQPGADDNASGVAALLELARLLGELRPAVASRIELVAFSLEEPPFFRTEQMGSAVHAASLRQEGAKVKAMLALEMLGYFSDQPGSQGYPISLLKLIYPSRGNFICVVGSTSGLGITRAVKARMAGASSLPVRSINAPSAIPGIDFSDHLNYWHSGYPAVMITDTAFYRNPNYHSPDDTPETLDFQRLADVVRGLYAAIVTL